MFSLGAQILSKRIIDALLTFHCAYSAHILRFHYTFQTSMNVTTILVRVMTALCAPTQRAPTPVSVNLDTLVMERTVLVSMEEVIQRIKINNKV